MQGKNTYFPLASTNLWIVVPIPMMVLSFVTSFTGVLHFTPSIKSLLNGVNPNDAPVSQISTVVWGSWDVLEPRRTHSIFALAVHVFMWLACVACCALAKKLFELSL